MKADTNLPRVWVLVGFMVVGGGLLYPFIMGLNKISQKLDNPQKVCEKTCQEYKKLDSYIKSLDKDCWEKGGILIHDLSRNKLRVSCDTK